MSPISRSLPGCSSRSSRLIQTALIQSQFGYSYVARLPAIPLTFLVVFNMPSSRYKVLFLTCRPQVYETASYGGVLSRGNVTKLNLSTENGIFLALLNSQISLVQGPSFDSRILAAANFLLKTCIDAKVH